MNIVDLEEDYLLNNAFQSSFKEYMQLMTMNNNRKNWGKYGPIFFATSDRFLFTDDEECKTAILDKKNRNVYINRSFFLSLKTHPNHEDEVLQDAFIYSQAHALTRQDKVISANKSFAVGGTLATLMLAHNIMSSQDTDNPYMEGMGNFFTGLLSVSLVLFVAVRSLKLKYTNPDLQCYAQYGEEVVSDLIREEEKAGEATNARRLTLKRDIESLEKLHGLVRRFGR